MASAPPMMPRVSALQGRKTSAATTDRREDREAAEPGHGSIVQVAVARVVQHAQPSREPGDRRSGDEGDQRGDEERPKGIELVHLGGA